MSLHRRELFRAAAALGIGPVTFHRALAATVQEPKAAATAVTAEMVKNAEWVAGIELTDDQRKLIVRSLSGFQSGFAAGRKVSVPYDVPPAIHFDPAPWLAPSDNSRGSVTAPNFELKKPDKPDDLAFLGVAKLSQLLRSKQVTSRELTELALARLKKHDPALLCVVTLTEELALKQAKQADEEIAAGKYRGPLHGIPWGAKDLIAYPGYKTTWGAGHFKEQTLDHKAAVAQILDDSGAVLVAKLTLGALAQGDQWFGGMTRNPWNPKTGSSGSSAGSASAVCGGLVPFAIGSETLGSIVSPSRVCGVTGLRPTFGRISRAGCMTLSWTMDKLGPLCRSVEDCALVLGTIHGADPADPASVTRPFDWPGKKPLKELRVGYVEGKKGADERPELKVLKELGVKLVPITLPSQIPTAAIQCVLDVESATAFDDITRAGVMENIGAAWPRTFRAGRFVSAVDYLRANRLRTLLMREMAKVMETVDLYVHGNDLVITNLTGHPSIVLPDGFEKTDGVEMPNAIKFTGRLFGETELLTVAHAYQNATGHHLKRPPL